MLNGPTTPPTTAAIAAATATITMQNFSVGVWQCVCPNATYAHHHHHRHHNRHHYLHRHSRHRRTCCRRRHCLPLRCESKHKRYRGIFDLTYLHTYAPAWIWARGRDRDLRTAPNKHDIGMLLNTNRMVLCCWEKLCVFRITIELVTRYTCVSASHSVALVAISIHIWNRFHYQIFKTILDWLGVFCLMKNFNSTPRSYKFQCRRKSLKWKPFFCYDAIQPRCEYKPNIFVNLMRGAFYRA